MKKTKLFVFTNHISYVLTLPLGSRKDIESAREEGHSGEFEIDYGASYEPYSYEIGNGYDEEEKWHIHKNSTVILYKLIKKNKTFSKNSFKIWYLKGIYATNGEWYNLKSCRDDILDILTVTSSNF